MDPHFLLWTIFSLSLPSNISRRWPAPPPPRYRFGRARVGLAEARFSQHKSFFRNFWSHGPQNRCIWSKISRGNWFWRLKLSIPSKIQEKWRKTDFRNPKKSIFFRIVFSTFWWSPRVVGGWNFDSAYLSTSRTCQGARTMTKIEFFRRISAKTSKIFQKFSRSLNSM